MMALGKCNARGLVHIEIHHLKDFPETDSGIVIAFSNLSVLLQLGGRRSRSNVTRKLIVVVRLFAKRSQFGIVGSFDSIQELPRAFFLPADPRRRHLSGRSINVRCEKLTRTA